MDLRRHNVYLIAAVVLIVAAFCMDASAQATRFDMWVPFLVRFRYHQTLYLIQALDKKFLSDFQEPHGIFCRLTLGELNPTGEIPLTLGDLKP